MVTPIDSNSSEDSATTTTTPPPLDVTFSSDKVTPDMFRTLMKRTDELQGAVQHLTYLITRLLSEQERVRQRAEFVDKPVEYHLYFKCSRDEALRVFGRAFSMAAELDGDLFSTMRAETATLHVIAYPTSLQHGW